MSEKHAYLIMAHDNFNILKKQLELLDDERNDFYIHIDQRAGEIDRAFLLENVRNSKVKFVERRKVYWADYTQTDTELFLLEEALAGGAYSYFHLLSGVDLPIKSKEYIFDFFKGSDKIFLCCMTKPFPYQEKRTRFYYPFIGTDGFRKSKPLKGVSLLLGRLQRLFFVNRHKKSGNYEVCYCGWNWFSIPLDFARYVMEQKDGIYSTFHHTLASDEAFMQTVAMNSEFKDRIYKTDCHEESVMRLIDWKRGRPYTFRKEDFEAIIDSPYLFARKFDEKTDPEIVDMLYREMKALNERGKA